MCSETASDIRLRCAVVNAGLSALTASCVAIESSTSFGKLYTLSQKCSTRATCDASGLHGQPFPRVYRRLMGAPRSAKRERERERERERACERECECGRACERVLISASAGASAREGARRRMHTYGAVRKWLATKPPYAANGGLFLSVISTHHLHFIQYVLFRRFEKSQHGIPKDRNGNELKRLSKAALRGRNGYGNYVLGHGVFTPVTTCDDHRCEQTVTTASLRKLVLITSTSALTLI